MAVEEKFVQVGQMYNVLVNKNNRFKIKLTSDLPVGSQITILNYIVGYSHLKVYWDGLLCEGGASNVYQYQEIGTAGATSDKISFWDIVPINLGF